MAENDDPNFTQRVDAHIDLANAQMKEAPSPRVAASMSFATARFNAYLCAGMYGTAEELQRQRDDAIRQLTEHYNHMLQDSFDDFIKNYASYMSSGGQ